MISSHSDNIDCCLLLFIKSNCWNQNLFWLTFHSSLPKRKRCSLFSRSSNFTSAPFRVFGIEKIKCFDIKIKSKLAIYCLWWNWNATPATTWSRVAVKIHISSTLFDHVIEVSSRSRSLPLYLSLSVSLSCQSFPSQIPMNKQMTKRFGYSKPKRYVYYCVQSLNEWQKYFRYGK